MVAIRMKEAGIFKAYRRQGYGGQARHPKLVSLETA